jgi:LPXTG-motif cell wall-anchored protein
VLGPVLFVTGFALGAVRVVRHFGAGPEFGVALLAAGLLVTVLGLVLARRRKARPRRFGAK